MDLIRMIFVLYLRAVKYRWCNVSMGIVSLKIGKGETAVMTETRRLYYEDVYKKEFTATVLECREHKNGFAVILDESAFIRKVAASRVMWELWGCEGDGGL